MPDEVGPLSDEDLAFVRSAVFNNKSVLSLSNHDAAALLKRLDNAEQGIVAERTAGKNALLEQRDRQRAFLETNIGDVIACEVCGVWMLSGEDGYGEGSSLIDPDDAFDVCNVCIATLPQPSLTDECIICGHGRLLHSLQVAGDCDCCRSVRAIPVAPEVSA